VVTIKFAVNAKNRSGYAYLRKVIHYRLRHMHVLLRDIHVPFSRLAPQPLSDVRYSQ